MIVLVVNAGSSSLKLAMFDVSETGTFAGSAFWRAHLTWSDSVRLRTVANGIKHEEVLNVDTVEATKLAVKSAWTGPRAGVTDALSIDAVGHRVVHGGRQYFDSTLITDDVLDDLQSLVPLAPLHEPASIRLMQVVKSLLPEVAQVAVFDTAYFHSMPETSYRYAVPYEWQELYGIRKYGFHGISHEYCATRAAEMLNAPSDSFRVITCHLGAGASITASKGGKSVGTTMGFTPLEGLVMGTRSGSIDPGLILYLLKEEQLALDDLNHVLNFESGMKGLSGSTGDMQALEKLSTSGDARAKLAIDMYVNSVASHVASLMTTIGGADAVVFAGGIGENSKCARAAVASKLAFLGVSIDQSRNIACDNDGEISSADSSIKLLVIHTKEEMAIAQKCRELVNARVAVQ